MYSLEEFGMQSHADEVLGCAMDGQSVEDGDDSRLVGRCSERFEDSAHKEEVASDGSGEGGGVDCSELGDGCGDDGGAASTEAIGATRRTRSLLLEDEAALSAFRRLFMEQYYVFMSAEFDILGSALKHLELDDKYQVDDLKEAFTHLHPEVHAAIVARNGIPLPPASESDVFFEGSTTWTPSARADSRHVDMLSWNDRYEVNHKLRSRDILRLTTLQGEAMTDGLVSLGIRNLDAARHRRLSRVGDPFICVTTLTMSNVRTLLESTAGRLLSAGRDLESVYALHEVCEWDNTRPDRVYVASLQVEKHRHTPPIPKITTPPRTTTETTATTTTTTTTTSTVSIVRACAPMHKRTHAPTQVAASVLGATHAMTGQQGPPNKLIKGALDVPTVGRKSGEVVLSAFKALLDDLDAGCITSNSHRPRLAVQSAVHSQREYMLNVVRDLAPNIELILSWWVDLTGWSASGRHSALKSGGGKSKGGVSDSGVKASRTASGRHSALKSGGRKSKGGVSGSGVKASRCRLFSRPKSTSRSNVMTRPPTRASRSGGEVDALVTPFDWRVRRGDGKGVLPTIAEEEEANPVGRPATRRYKQVGFDRRSKKGKGAKEPTGFSPPLKKRR